MSHQFSIFRCGVRVALGVVLVMGLSIGFSQSMTSISLKYNSTVEGNVITLGDVFSGLDSTSEKAQKVLGAAPPPGKDMTLNARTLMRVAIAMDLPWRPQSQADQVVLRRAARVVSTDMIKDALKADLRDQGINGIFDLNLITGAREFILPVKEPKTMAIEDLRFDGDQNRFEAIVVAPSLDNPIVRERISGIIQRMVEVPVLRNVVKNGRVIRDQDIDIITVRAETLKHDMVLHSDEMIGMTPRRIVMAGAPLQVNDLEQPQVIERGEMVTMVFNDGMLSLTAQGKALESGAKGDIIRVVNASSSKTLQAQVLGTREVSVAAF